MKGKIDNNRAWLLVLPARGLMWQWLPPVVMPMLVLVWPTTG